MYNVTIKAEENKVLITVLDHSTNSVLIHSVNADEVSEDGSISYEKIEDYLVTLDYNISNCSFMTSDILYIKH